ncbi:hypothetical protein LguiB_013589 [Lonicera macranthoides]
MKFYKISYLIVLIILILSVFLIPSATSSRYRLIAECTSKEIEGRRCYSCIIGCKPPGGSKP